MTQETKVRGHVTTEGTGKSLKLQQVIAVLLMIGGIMWAMLAAQEPRVGGKPPGGMMTGISAMAFGIVWYGAVRFMRWWHHG